MQRGNMQITNGHTSKNGGFSLLEVLVCVAVLAVICIPVLRGFETSSRYNKRAYETQNITAYTQQLTEHVQHESMESFAAAIKAADADSVSTWVDTVQQAEFPEDNPGEIYPQELFTVTTCVQKNVMIGGSLYDATVVYDPRPYSVKKAEAEPVLESTAKDSNVYTVADINAVDGMKYAVIADEINSHEGVESQGSAILYTLLDKLTAQEKTASALTETELLKKLYYNTGKQIVVTIRQSGGSVLVNCDVVYECIWPRTITLSYNVYQSQFELMENKDESGNFVSWKQGGKIYIFAKAWQEQHSMYGAADMPRYNKIAIRNETDSTTPPLEIYLVRGYYYTLDAQHQVSSRNGLQFDEVTVYDTAYPAGLTYARMSAPEVLTGELDTGKTRLHTNIKGQLSGRQLMQADYEAAIGRERAKVRCYKVTVTLTDQNAEVAAQIVTTKEVKE